MPRDPIIKRGEKYFCPECGHMMEEHFSTCPACHIVFDGMVEEVAHDAAHPPTTEEIEVVDELDREMRIQRLWTLVIIVSIAAAAIVALVFLLR